MTAAGTVTEFFLSIAGTTLHAIRQIPDGNLWFGDYAGNKNGSIIMASEGTTAGQVCMLAAHLTLRRHAE